ncbi:MAG: hypothetical protein GY839_10030 [candidate division Zixibacteria bacterium]|nr:hypothetical protein [candidate division Zixibacteria bacterium]
MKRLYIVLVLILLSFNVISATIINVPADQPTIQSGIDASSAGDTVLVADGTYSGAGNFNISIGGHALTLISEHGASNCTISPGGPENRCFIISSDIDQSTLIDGFTVYNGTSQASGAGVYCSQNSSPIISNCTFIYMVSYDDGGVMYLANNSTATIRNCLFESNAAFETGGAIFSNSSSGIIENCQFIENQAIRGGAIVCTNGGSPIIRNCEFDENHSTEVGGTIYLKECTPEIAFCTIKNTVMSINGGGIFCGMSADANIHHCTFAYNTCMEYGNGICCANCSPNIAYCLFEYNRDFNPGGGGIACLNGTQAFISNCTFYRNMANQGGAIYSLNSTVTITNSLLWYNEADNDYSEIDYIGDAPVVRYCDVYGGWPGEGNLNCEPLYCYADTGNYYLQAVSCCLNAAETGNHIGAFGIGCGGLDYYPGDINMAIGQWPPQVIGEDLTYLVNFLRSTNAPCLLDSFFCPADINGDCHVIGSDATRMVNYFREMVDISFCLEKPPMWRILDDLPVESPVSWPNCE